jgi:hypothetical protein
MPEEGPVSLGPTRPKGLHVCTPASRTDGNWRDGGEVTRKEAGGGPHTRCSDGKGVCGEDPGGPETAWVDLQSVHARMKKHLYTGYGEQSCQSYGKTRYLGEGADAYQRVKAMNRLPGPPASNPLPIWTYRAVPMVPPMP